jgi:hypothetical protein
MRLDLYHLDIGKSIEVPGAVSPQVLPAPYPTLLATITGVGGTCVSGKCTTATITPNSTKASNGVAVTWGTDNATPFQNVATSCPLPTNSSSYTPNLGPKGCVIVVPNPGASGTGDYMFGSGVTLSTQTSFEILGMGNSSKWENSQQAGVRLLTAMPITILTVGQSSGAAGTANYGGFHLDNISFVDTSSNGSALGGLLMYNISEAVISYSDFENFNGEIADPANSSFPNILAYGMKANPVGGTNNNIVLIHDKGKNNAIFYDASIWGQDGPIVIGGDIFPVIQTPPGSNYNTGFSLPCYGFINAGPMQIYGTHFDTGANNYIQTSPPACYAIKMLNSGIIHGKFESSASPHGNGILVQGGSTFQQNSLAALRTCSGTNCYVSILASGNAYTLGQVVNVTNCADTTYQGHFAVTSTGSTFTYDDNNASSSSTTGCSIAGVTTSAASIEALAANTPTAVTIQSGATNNKALISIPTSAAAATGAYSDLGTNDTIEVYVSNPGNSYSYNGTAIFNGTLQVPVAASLTTTTNGQIGYNTTGQVPHMAVNGLDASVATFTGTPISGDCVKWNGTAPIQLTDSNGGCNNAGFMFFCLGGATTAGTVTLAPGGGGTVCTSTGTPTDVPVPFGGTLKNLYVNVGTKTNGTDSVTVWRNGSATSITCNLTSAAFICKDVTDTAGPVSPGDLISIRVVAGSSDMLANVRASVQLQ